MSTEQIARLHGTHKSTISRNLASTRYELMKHVETCFKQAGLQTVTDLGDLADMMDSGIELSLSRLLNSAP